MKQGKGEIILSQLAYAGKLLDRCGMQDCNPSTTPMESRLKLNKESTAELVNATEYRSIIGAIWYLLHTRPDLSFSVGYLSRFMEKPHEDHLTAMKRVLRYVAETQGQGLHYRKLQKEELKLIGFSDTDMAGDTDDRKSTSGSIFFLGGNLIAWQSSKQELWPYHLAKQST